MKNIKEDKAMPKGSKELALHYMKTLIDVARESFLILDADLRVVEANPTFYENFKVTRSETENIALYELGNGQWNIPELKKLLEDILPKEKNVRNYEVMHNFETIGKKTMLLNAGQVDESQLIILAIEDVTSKGDLENKVKELETLNQSMIGRELKMVELKKEIEDLKKKNES